MGIYTIITTMGDCEKCGAIANKAIELEVFYYKLKNVWVRMCDGCFTIYKTERLKKEAFFGFSKRWLNELEFKAPECEKCGSTDHDGLRPVCSETESQEVSYVCDKC